MANKGFNGTTVTFSGLTLTSNLKSVKYGAKVKAVDVTASSDTEMKNVAGIKSKTLTITTIGGLTDVVGSVGNLVANFFDNTSMTITNALCESVETDGAMDGAITTTYSFVSGG